MMDFGHISIDKMGDEDEAIIMLKYDELDLITSVG